MMMVNKVLLNYFKEGMIRFVNLFFILKEKLNLLINFEIRRLGNKLVNM